MQSLIIWILLTILTLILNDITLFLQTKEFMRNDSMILKIINNEFWATILWCVAIPAIRIGYTIMNPIKLTMLSYLLMFGGQIVSNYTWLNEPTTIDDYATILIAIVGLTISTYKVFG
jgi:hypothetical protein